MKTKILLFILISAGFLTSAARAQQPISLSAKELHDQILAMDKKVFTAYNSCNLDEFETYFTKDVEFFNDRTGYTESRRDLMKNMKTVCESGGMERHLVSAKVYLLDFYGAIETGTQRYYRLSNGKKEAAGTSTFTNIWKLENGEWKIARVISYDYKP